MFKASATLSSDNSIFLKHKSSAIMLLQCEQTIFKPSKYEQSRLQKTICIISHGKELKVVFLEVKRSVSVVFWAKM
jgi:hypothetical protein